MKNILILFGGASNEYDVSLKSTMNIIDCLKDKYNLIMVGINKHGQWFYYNGAYQNIENNTWQNHDAYPLLLDFNNPSQLIINDLSLKIKVDCALVVIHGKNGEDGSIQGLLKLLNIPIIGPNPLTSAICMDKDVAHRLVKQAGLKVPKSLCLRSKDDDYLDYFNKDEYPLFIKPANEGSSCGMSKVTNQKDLTKAINYAFTFDSKVIIEKNIQVLK